MFAIPTGIFGAGFEDMIQHRKQGKQQRQQQQEEQEAALQLDSLPASDVGIDTSVGGAVGSGSPVGGYYTLAPPVEGGGGGGDGDNSVDISGHAYGDGGGANAGSSAGGAGTGVGWALLGDGGGGGGGGGKALGEDCGGGVGCGGDDGGSGVGGLSFLNTGTGRGKAYRAFLLAVVVLDILAFFASTTFYLQVREREREQGGEISQEAFSMLCYVLRVQHFVCAGE